MSIGLHRSRAARGGSDGGGREGKLGPTVREVCLLGGGPSRSGSERWAAGQRVTWLGRGYQVVARSATPAESIDGRPVAGPSRHYIHLAPGSECSEAAG